MIMNNKLEKEVETYIQTLEEMVHITSHKVRAPVCTSLGLIQILNNNPLYTSGMPELRRLIEPLERKIAEIDHVTRELTLFINEKKNSYRDKLSFKK